MIGFKIYYHQDGNWYTKFNGDQVLCRLLSESYLTCADQYREEIFSLIKSTLMNFRLEGRKFYWLILIVEIDHVYDRVNYVLCFLHEKYLKMKNTTNSIEQHKNEYGEFTFVFKNGESFFEQVKPIIINSQCDWCHSCVRHLEKKQYHFFALDPLFK